MTAGPVGVLVATNYSAILRPLQWLVVVLVFLFFLRVVRAVWVEVRPAGPRQTRADRRRAAREERRAVEGNQPRRRRRQLFLEILEPEHQAGRTFDLDDELTIGRSPGCGVSTSYDVYSSTLHSRLYRRGEQLWVEDLGSTNGTFVNSERIAKPTKLAKGDLLQVGATVFEVTR
ncbi:MAG TPA: FHA domain-containing protein [Acidimicrobiales bacterium]|nr:FHA domain-containing protein [Acidimicrobiales bacterium]